MKEITPMVACLIMSGKTIKNAKHAEAAPLSHGGDELLIEFTDGTSLTVMSKWYSGGTALITYYISEEEKK